MCPAQLRLLDQPEPQLQQTGHVRHARICTLTSSLTSWRVLSVVVSAMHPEEMLKSSVNFRRFKGIGVSN